MTIGGKIQLFRKRFGLSQEDLANQLDVSRQTVSKWETDAMKPETDKIIALSKMLEVSTDTILLEEIELSSAHVSVSEETTPNKKYRE